MSEIGRGHKVSQDETSTLLNEVRQLKARFENLLSAATIEKSQERIAGKCTALWQFLVRTCRQR